MSASLPFNRTTRETSGKALKDIPEVLRKTLTYDQHKEMSNHAAYGYAGILR
jgi:hypothetical protein